MDPDVVELSKIFLVPGSILVGALGVAKTEGLKTGVSTLGLLTALFWLICNIGARWAGSAASWRVFILTYLPALFIVCWLIAGWIHFWKWWRQRKPKEVSYWPLC